MDDASPLQGRDADRARELRRVKLAATAAAGLDGRAVHRGTAFRAGALGVGLCRGLRGRGDGRRAGGLVCRRRPVPPAARPADPAYRHHPAQPRAHRRQSRQLHRDQLPGARDGREEAGRGRLRRAHGSLARRYRAQRGAGGLRDPDVAQGPGGDRRGRPAPVPGRAGAASFRRSRSRRSLPACWARSPRKASTGACSTSCWACWRSS